MNVVVCVSSVPHNQPLYLAGHLCAAKLVHVYSIMLVLLTKEALGLSRLFSFKSISCIF